MGIVTEMIIAITEVTEDDLRCDHGDHSNDCIDHVNLADAIAATIVTITCIVEITEVIMKDTEAITGTIMDITGVIADVAGVIKKVAG